MTTRICLVLAAATLSAPLSAQGSADAQPIGPLPAETQIAFAVQAAPPEMRQDATVQGYDEGGNFVTLREGTNDMVCMAPNPEMDQFEAEAAMKATATPVVKDPRSESNLLVYVGPEE